MALDFVRNNFSSLKSWRDDLSSKDGKLVIPGGIVNFALNIVKRHVLKAETIEKCQAILLKNKIDIEW